MNQEVKEAIGTIESKEEKAKKDGELFWKYLITIDGSTLTFSQWKYEEGKDVRTGSKVKVFWTEKEGQGQHGPITYRNINSIGTLDKYEATQTASTVDPAFKYKTDEQLAEQAPKEALKEVVHKEGSGVSGVSGGTPTTYGQKEDRRQLLIVRQSALNYATQLAVCELAWQGQLEGVTINKMKEKIKEIAKEYEAQVVRK